MALKLVLWDDEKNRYVTTSGSFPDHRAGEVDVPEGVTSVEIIFSSPLPNTSYSPIPVFKNTVDTYPQFQTPVVTAFTVNGFTASWNAPTDSENYKLSYTCLIHS